MVPIQLPFARGILRGGKSVGRARMPAAQCRATTTRILGLDLGQARDHTAGVLLERNNYPSTFQGQRDDRFRGRLVKRWPLGTDYTALAVEVIETLPVDFLVIDFGGVGRAVVDLFRKEIQERGFSGRIIPVALIGSSAAGSLVRSLGRIHYNVPKVEVLTSIVLLWQQKRLTLPPGPETQLLIEEMRNFRLHYTKAANLTMDAAPGQHDDLVIALGLGCWWGLRERKAAFLW